MASFKCNICGHQWFSRETARPKRCPHCKSRRWSSISLTQKELRSALYYDPVTGVMTWKKPTGARVKPGDVFGSPMSSGYLAGQCLNHSDTVHRFVWLWWYGYIPETCIEHINGDKQDNRLCNLREVSYSCNLRNYGNPADNTSGVRGVSRNPRKTHKNIWIVAIAIKRRRRTIGYFSDFDEAVFTRYAAEQCLDWPDCNSTSPAYQYLVGRGLIQVRG